MGVTKFKMQIKGQAEPIIDARWGGGKERKIKVDDSLWTIERNNDAIGKAVLQICLTKYKHDEWWHSVWEGHQEIRTKDCAPENTKLSDLDAETRKHVERGMFDQRQKEKGGQSSDEIQKKDALKGFFDAHPEIDRNNVKIQ